MYHWIELLPLTDGRVRPSCIQYLFYTGQVDWRLGSTISFFTRFRDLLSFQHHLGKDYQQDGPHTTAYHHHAPSPEQPSPYRTAHNQSTFHSISHCWIQSHTTISTKNVPAWHSLSQHYAMSVHVIYTCKGIKQLRFDSFEEHTLTEFFVIHFIIKSSYGRTRKQRAVKRSTHYSVLTTSLHTYLPF